MDMLKIHLRFYHNISQKHTCWHRIVFTIYHKITTSALSMLKTFHCNHRATTKRQIQNQKQCGHTQKKNIPYGGSVTFRNCRTNSKFLFWGRKNVTDDVSTAKWPNSRVIKFMFWGLRHSPSFWHLKQSSAEKHLSNKK